MNQQFTDAYFDLAYLTIYEIPIQFNFNLNVKFYIVFIFFTLFYIFFNI